MKPRLTCGPLPNAPGLTICAGISEPQAELSVSATGVDGSQEIARAKCCAEFHERAAIIRLRASAAPTDSDGAAHVTPQAMARLTREALAVSPASFGAAAGRTMAEARDNALAELIERWRGRLWWAGIVRPLSASAHATAKCDAALDAWRAERPDKSGLLILLRGETWVVAAAWSSAADGRWLRIGLGCAADEADAVVNATQERTAMEFGLGLIIRKRRKDMSLSPEEQVIIERAQRRFDILGDSRLQPTLGAADDETPDPEFEMLNSGTDGLHIALASDTGLYQRRFGPASSTQVFSPSALDFLA